MQCFVAVYMYHSLSGHCLPVHGSFHIGSHNIKYIGQRYKLNRLLSDFFGCKYYLVLENVFNCDLQNIASLLYNTCILPTCTLIKVTWPHYPWGS